jgi:ketosteroid isomerase-like protein
MNAQSEEQVKSFNVGGKYSLKSFEVIKSRCEEDSCFATYILKYKTKLTDGGAAESEIKELAELEKVQGQWKIADVKGIKSYISSEDSISVYGK